MPSRLSLVVPPLVQLGGGSNKRKRLSATESAPAAKCSGPSRNRGETSDRMAVPDAS